MFSGRGWLRNIKGFLRPITARVEHRMFSPAFLPRSLPIPRRDGKKIISIVIDTDALLLCRTSHQPPAGELKMTGAPLPLWQTLQDLALPLLSFDKSTLLPVRTPLHPTPPTPPHPRSMHIPHTHHIPFRPSHNPQLRFAISHSIKPWIIQSRWNWFLDSLIANQNRTSGPVHSLGAIFDNQIFMEKWNVSRSFLLLAD